MYNKHMVLSCRCYTWKSAQDNINNLVRNRIDYILINKKYKNSILQGKPFKNRYFIRSQFMSDQHQNTSEKSKENYVKKDQYQSIKRTKIKNL